MALACDQLVMQPDAHVGGKGSVELDRIDARRRHDRRSAIRSPARRTKAGRCWRRWSIPKLEVFSYQNTKTGDVRYFSKEEADELRKMPRIGGKARRSPPTAQPLRLSSRQAEELGVAWHVVDSLDELKQLYGFEHDPRVAEPNWALELVEALSSPALTVFLIAIGFIGIYIELHSPGVGIGGFLAAVAFMLFFWSKFLHGTAGWLEVLLFTGGMFCLLLGGVGAARASASSGWAAGR